MQITLKREVKHFVYDDYDIPLYMEEVFQTLVSVDRKIAAIKLLRSWLNRNDNLSDGRDSTCGLKEAKDFIEENFRKGG